MYINAPFVLHERFVAGLVRFDPVANVFAELKVVGGGTVELVGEGAEETIAVAEGGGGVEPKRAQLRCEELGVLRGVGQELLGLKLGSGVNIDFNGDWMMMNVPCLC